MNEKTLIKRIKFILKNNIEYLKIFSRYYIYTILLHSVDNYCNEKSYVYVNAAYSNNTLFKKDYWFKLNNILKDNLKMHAKYYKKLKYGGIKL